MGCLLLVILAILLFGIGFTAKVVELYLLAVIVLAIAGAISYRSR